jgi:hypothetical protein
MPTYNSGAVSNTAIGFQKPITLQQGRGLRDNPLAIAEGATGAPYMITDWHPYNSGAVGDSNTGRIWSFAVDGTATTITTPDFVDGFEYRLRFDGLTASGIGGAVRIQLFREATGSLGATVDITSSSSNPIDGTVDILRPRLDASGVVLVPSLIFGTGSSVAPIAYPYSAARQKALRAVLSPSASNFGAGAVFMDRRRIYA